MKVKFGEKEIVIAGKRLQRFAARSEFIKNIIDVSGQINDDFIIERPAADNDLIDIFNDIIDAETVWHFMIKYNIDAKRDVIPHKDDLQYPPELVKFTNLIDRFVEQIQQYFQFFWLISPYIANFEKEVTRKYFDRAGEKLTIPQFGYTILVDDMSKYIDEDGEPYVCHKQTKNVPVTSSVPYRSNTIYEYVINHMSELAEEDINVPEHTNAGLVSYYWSQELNENVDDYRGIRLLLPIYFEKHSRKPFTVVSYLERLKKMSDNNPFYNVSPSTMLPSKKINFKNEVHREYYDIFMQKYKHLDLSKIIDILTQKIARKSRTVDEYVEHKINQHHQNIEEFNVCME